MAPNLNEGRRHVLVGMISSGMTITEVMKKTGVSRPTLYALLKKHRATGGSLKARGGQGRKRTMHTRENIKKVRKDASPLDFSMWARYAARVGNTKHKNRDDR